MAVYCSCRVRPQPRMGGSLIGLPKFSMHGPASPPGGALANSMLAGKPPMSSWSSTQSRFCRSCGGSVLPAAVVVGGFVRRTVAAMANAARVG